MLEIAIVAPPLEECRDAALDAIRIASDLRRSGRQVWTAHGKFPGGQLRNANKESAIWAIIVGSEESAAKMATLKCMVFPYSVYCPLTNIVDYFWDEFEETK